MLPDKAIIKMNVAFADFNFCDRVAVENFQNRLNKISIYRLIVHYTIGKMTFFAGI